MKTTRSLTLSIDGKPCLEPDSWSQNLDAEGARSVVTNVFGSVTRVVETFVAADADVIAVRQTFPGTEEARLAVGVDYSEPRDERIVGKWEDAQDGRAFVYTAYGRNVDKGRITLRHTREGGAFVSFISFGKPYTGSYAAPIIAGIVLVGVAGGCLAYLRWRVTTRPWEKRVRA